LPSLPCLVVWL